jgi:hypothetical protein
MLLITGNFSTRIMLSQSPKETESISSLFNSIGKKMLDTITGLVTALAALGALGISVINLKQIRTVHISINSRMDQLLKATGIAARAEGKEEGRAEK